MLPAIDQSPTCITMYHFLTDQPLTLMKSCILMKLWLNVLSHTTKIYTCTRTVAEQNNGNTKKLRARIYVCYIEELPLATLNVLPFVSTL
jgi:hypothetical protein